VHRSGVEYLPLKKTSLSIIVTIAIVNYIWFKWRLMYVYSGITVLCCLEPLSLRYRRVIFLVNIIVVWGRLSRLQIQWSRRIPRHRNLRNLIFVVGLHITGLSVGPQLVRTVIHAMHDKWLWYSASFVMWTVLDDLYALSLFIYCTVFASVNH